MANMYGNALEHSLMVSLAMHALLGKFDEFSLQEIEYYIFNKLPDSHKDIIPREIVKKNYQRVIDMGITHDVFTTTNNGKYKLTEHGKDLAARFIIDTASLYTDPTQN